MNVVKRPAGYHPQDVKLFFSRLDKEEFKEYGQDFLQWMASNRPIQLSILLEKMDMAKKRGER